MPRLRRTPRSVLAALAGIALVGGPLAAPALADSPSDAPTSDQAPAQADPDKSFAVYVGKNLTENGHTMLGGFGHEPSSHWLEVVPAQDHPKGAEITVGATPEADMPAKLSKIPQVRHTASYITSNYSEFAGFPAPLTNGGLNEHNVAARDVWSNSREELWDMTPTDQTGPQYSDLSRIAMERATSAREAVVILGDLIDEYGYTTYGGNSHLFADENEGWVFIEMSGGKGLWAAERLGPDDIRVSYPGYIHDFPVDAAKGTKSKNPDFMGSANLVSFATKQGWYNPGKDDSFNLQEVYGQPFPTDEFEVGEDADPSDPAPYRNPVSLEKEFATLGDDIKLEDVMRIVRDPRWSDDRSGYGQVAELRSDLADPSLATLWVASTAAATAPYLPISIGTEELPEEYTQHRYLTAEASSTYLGPEYAEQEATEYATQTYKRLMYAACARPERHLGDVTAALEGFEAESIRDWDAVQKRASTAGADAADVLTDYTYDRALDGLLLGNQLLDDVLGESRASGGLKTPDVEVPAGTTAQPQSLPMKMDGVSSRDRMNCDVGGGWADGNATERAGTYGDPADVPDYSDARISGRPATEIDTSAAESDQAPATGLIWGLGGLLLGSLAGGFGLRRARRRA